MDHVPPKCLFPEHKDLPPGVDYRKNLITVPACDEHNLRRSEDDEYILSIITTYYKNNPVGEMHFLGKVMRSLERRPAHQEFFREHGFALVDGALMGAIHVDVPRLERAMEQVGRGLFYHHFGRKHGGAAMVLAYRLIDLTSETRGQVNATLHDWAMHSEWVMQSEPRYGENQEAFYYQVLQSGDRTVLRLVFYGGFAVDVVFVPMARAGGTDTVDAVDGMGRRDAGAPALGGPA